MEDFTDIQNTNTVLSKYEKEKFHKAQNRLLQHVTNPDNYRAKQYAVFNGAEINKDFSSQNQRRSYFVDCIFEKSCFKNAGFSGSYFVNCIFRNCDFNFSFFDNCFFRECAFVYNENNEILSASFCNSIFLNCNIECLWFHSCSFSNSTFKNTHIEKTIFDDIVWENSLVSSCEFIEVKLLNLNLEFVNFQNNKLIETNLPFASIPFSFNCIKYLLETSDNVRIDSETHKCGITKDEYISSIIPDLICFYEHTNNYFPLANILASIGQLEQSYQVICNSIPFLIKIHEFRTLNYISVLMKSHDFTTSQKHEVYKLINKELYHQTLAQEDYWLNAEIYMFEIRNNLLNGQNDSYVTFEIYTNIESFSKEKLNMFVNSLETIFENISKESTYYIEYRHNSPFQFLVTAISSPEGILEIIGTSYLVLLGIDKFYNKYLSTKQKHLDIEKTKEEIALLKKQNAAFNTDNKNTKETLEEAHQQLYNNNIKINNIYHTVHNVDVRYYGNDFQHYTNE